MKKVVITGGSGFIGTNLISFLENDYQISIYNLDIKEPRNKKHIKFWVELDVRDYNNLLNFILKIQPDYIVHLAARTDLNGKNNIDEYNTNTIGVSNILDVAKKTDYLNRILIFSSMLVNQVGYIPKNNLDYNATTFYGKSKVETELITRKYNIDWVILRPTSIWGPWFSEPYLNFFMYIKKNLYISTPQKNSAIKTYGFVTNTCHQIIEILYANKDKVTHKTFYLGDYNPLNITEWADEISLQLHGKKTKKIPKSLFLLLCILGDVFRKIGIRILPLSYFRYKNMTTNNIVDLSQTKYIVEQLPIKSSKIQIQETLNWINNEIFEK